MASPRKQAAQRAPMPVVAAAEEALNELAETSSAPRVQRPGQYVVASLAPKPTLWQRLWYGARAEQRLLSQLPATTVQAPLDAVKAGVLAEMQNISRTQGGVSGSPFANVVLPQSARASMNANMNTSMNMGPKATASVAAKTAPVAAPRQSRQGGRSWLPLLLVVVGLGALWFYANRVMQFYGQQVSTTPPSLSATKDALLPPPQLAPEVKLVAKPVVAQPTPVAAPIDVLATQPTLMGVAQLAQVVSTQQLTATPIANSQNQLMVSAKIANTGTQVLEKMSMALAVSDQAGVPLLRRTLALNAPVAAGQSHTQRFVLDLLPTQREALVATAPWGAFKTSLMPLRAETR